jgi:hypothetical protein
MPSMGSPVPTPTRTCLINPSPNPNPAPRTLPPGWPPECSGGAGEVHLMNMLETGIIGVKAPPSPPSPLLTLPLPRMGP